MANILFTGQSNTVSSNTTEKARLNKLRLSGRFHRLNGTTITSKILSAKAFAGQSNTVATPTAGMWNDQVFGGVSGTTSEVLTLLSIGSLFIGASESESVALAHVPTILKDYSKWVPVQAKHVVDYRVRGVIG